MDLKRIPAIVKVIVFILGIIALLGGQVWASIVHWLRIPDDSFDAVAQTSCSILPCNIRYPYYFGLVLLILLLAVILLGWSMRRTVLRLTLDINWLALIPVQQASQTRRLPLVLVAISLVVSVLAAISALTSVPVYPNPLIWLAAVLLWGITFYSFDRVNQRKAPLSRGEIISLFAYIILVGVVGYVYQISLMQSINARALFVLVVTLIAGVLWRIKRISGVAAIFAIITVVGLAIYSYNITSWRYSFWGDEYAYFDNASTVVQFVKQGGNILDSYGVYQANPMGGTVLQGVIMLLYGEGIYSWRISGALMVFLAAPAIFWLVRRLKGAGTGLLAVVVFVSSHYLIGLTRVGYVQPDLLPVFAAMLVFAVIALDQRSALAMYLSAAAGAMSFYTFLLGFPLIPTPLLLLALWVLWPTREQPFIRRLSSGLRFVVIFLIGLWVVAFPRVLNTTWIGDAGFTTVFQSQVTGLTNPLLQQVIPNVVYTLGASIYFDANSHYTSGAHLDPLSSALMLAGIAGLIAVATKRRIALWLLLSFLAAAAVIGGFVPYPYPPHTRTYLLEIFYALFAALGAAYLWETARDIGLRLPALALRAGFALAGIAIIALNAYQFFHLSELDIPKSEIALVMQQFEESSPDTTLYYVARTPDDGNLKMVIQDNAYDLNRFKPITDPSALEALTDIQHSATAPYRIIIVPDMDHPEMWTDAAQTVWPDRPLQIIRDDAEVGIVKVISVPAKSG